MVLRNVFAWLYGWEPCDFATYKMVWQQFGGSVCTHPDVLQFLSAETGAKLDFYVIRRKQVYVGACYAVKGSLSLQDRRYPFVFDDIMLPLQTKKVGYLPAVTKRLSPRHRTDFLNVLFSRYLKNKLCYVKESLSKASQKKRNGEMKKFLACGGEVRWVDDFSDSELADIYIDVFKQRWQGKIYCFTRDDLIRTFAALRHLLFGAVLFIHGRPCAFDIIFMAECDGYFYFDDINGGYSQNYPEFNLGSILLWVNICKAKELCTVKDKKFKFSLGVYKDYWSYKKQWCDILPLGRTLF